MTNRPFASIILPTYNHQKYIGQALDSLLAQTDPSWEAIVVDDGSTDQSGAIIDAYAARDPRIRAFHQANGGVAAALNAGLRQARGEWVHWLSSDDLFKPEKLAINRDWIARHADAEFFFSHFWLLREKTGELTQHDLWGPLPEAPYQLLTLLFRNYVSGISICVKREAWDEAGHFDPTLRYAQDYDQWLRLLSRRPGIFIPEWMVISRNHAEQGSEVFPEACYFDTAKAAIRLLNRAPFAALVPWTDLNDEAAARAAAAKALEIACEPTAFLYALGVHPGLMLRLLEWAFPMTDAPPPSEDLRAMIIARVRAMALEDGEDEWHWMWRDLAAALALPAPRFTYRPIDPTALGRRDYAARRARGGAAAEPLRVYLERFEGIRETPTRPPGAGTDRVVLIASSATAAEAAATAAELAALGHRPVVIRPQDSAYLWDAAGSSIARHPFDPDGLPWLGAVAAAVALDGAAVPAWIAARSRLALGHDDAGSSLPTPAVVAEILRSLGRMDPARGLRPVVFLQRVLTGGGAERVVLDLARHLDRRRFRPVVLTLFEPGDASSYPKDILIRCVRRFVDGPPPSLEQDAPPPPSTPDRGAGRMAIGPKVLARARAVYHRLSPAWRQRLHPLIGGLRQGRAVWRERGLRGVLGSLWRQAASPAGAAAGRRKVARHSLFLQALDAHWPAAQGLRHLLSRLGPNPALLAVMEEASVAAWMAQIGGATPYIASLHTVESRYLPQMHPLPDRLAVETWAFANACQAARRAVFPSVGAGRDLTAHFGVEASAVRTIPNPVDCAGIRRLSWMPAPEIDDLVSGVAQVFVHVARLDREKNHQLLLDACARLAVLRADFVVLCVGEGDNRPEIEAEIARLDLRHRVRLLGARSNPFPIVARARALILTSHFESFALVLPEAMACGTPVIAVDCPHGPREVLQGGEHGILVPPGDADALAAAMAGVADDEARRQHLIASGFRRAASLDVAKVTRMWEELVDLDLPAAH